MKKLSEALPFSFVKLLNYFSFRLSFKSETHAVFSNPGRIEKFYLFNEPDKDQLTIYSTVVPGVITKEILLFQLADVNDPSLIVQLVPTVGNFTQVDDMPNFKQVITVENIASVSLELGELSETDAAWYKLPAFDKRIFKGKNGGFKIPLCLYNDRKFIQFVNTVEGKDNDLQYMNSRRDGFFSSNLLASCTKTFITSNPYSWERFALKGEAHDYFFLLGHQEATDNLFSGLLKLHLKYSFSVLAFPITNSLTELSFVLRFINYCLAQFLTEPIVTLSAYQGFYNIEIRTRSQDTVHVLTSFISQLNMKLESLFFSSLKKEFEIDDLICRTYRPTVSRLNSNGLTIYSIQIKNNPQIGKTLLETLCFFLQPQVKLEFHLLV